MDNEYIIETRLYAQPGSIIGDCNAIMFTNKGTATALINGEPIAEGESIINNGLKGETDRSQYTISFNGAGTTLVWARFKRYKKR